MSSYFLILSTFIYFIFHFLFSVYSWSTESMEIWFSHEKASLKFRNLKVIPTTLVHFWWWKKRSKRNNVLFKPVKSMDFNFPLLFPTTPTTFCNLPNKVSISKELCFLIYDLVNFFFYLIDGQFGTLGDDLDDYHYHCLWQLD